MQNEGGEKFRPIILEKEAETCCICTEVPVDVVCCPECDNGPFCKSCFEECFEINDTCPTCNQEVYKLPGVNKVLQKLILKYAALCSHEGCQKEGSLEQILNHMKNCEKMLVTCKNQAEGCTIVLRKENIEEHEGQCQFKRLQCTCGASLLRKEEEEHQQTTCPIFTVPCDHCFKRVLRNQLTEHQSNHCVKRTVKCINSDIGCTYTDSYEKYNEIHEFLCPYALTAPVIRSLLELTKLMSKRIGKLEQKTKKQATIIATLKRQDEEIANCSFQRKGTANVVMTVDFSKYQPRECVFSDEFKVAELSCNLQLFPKGKQFYLNNPEVCLRVNSIMGSEEFLIVLKYRLDDIIGSCVSLFTSKQTAGYQMNNNVMLTRNGIETLEFMVSVEVLDILLVGKDVQKVEEIYENMHAIEKEKSFGIENGVCTGTMNSAEQEMFKCTTCNVGNLCQVCVEKCHQTHEVVTLGKQNSYCSCSAHGACKVLPFRKLLQQCNEQVEVAEVAS